MAFGVVTLHTVETRGTGPAGETVDTPSHRALASATRVKILRLVRAAPAGLTAADAAAATGLHLSTVRAHLERLSGAGLLVRDRASGGGPGRPPWRYHGAAADPAPAPYRALAAALLRHLSDTSADGHAAAVRMGEGWGRQLAAEHGPVPSPAGATVAVLDALGFAPSTGHRTGLDLEVHLQRCPFLDLVSASAEAMCAVHLGVIRGTLTEFGGGDATAVELEPFGAPTACVVRLPEPNRAQVR